MFFWLSKALLFPLLNRQEVALLDFGIIIHLRECLRQSVCHLHGRADLSDSEYHCYSMSQFGLSLCSQFDIPPSTECFTSYLVYSDSEIPSESDPNKKTLHGLWPFARRTFLCHNSKFWGKINNIFSNIKAFCINKY